MTVLNAKKITESLSVESDMHSLRQLTNLTQRLISKGPHFLVKIDYCMKPQKE